MRGGTGQKFEAAATITAGVASVLATLMSIVYGALCLVNACAGFGFADMFAVATDQYGYKREKPTNEVA